MDTKPPANVNPDQSVVMLAADQATHPSFDLVLIGGPGSGKGTQAEQIQLHLGLLHIASGDLFRDNIANETELGILAKGYMDQGELVPDDVTQAMVKERITREDASSGFILDGFPRTINQAWGLTRIMNDAGRRINGVVYIQVSDDQIVQRLSGRMVCRSCHATYHKQYNPPMSEGICDGCRSELYQRDDDNPDTVRARLKVFHTQTTPVVDYYRDAGVLLEIDGEGDLENITARILERVDKLRGDSS